MTTIEFILLWNWHWNCTNYL